jgi:hypothetical protein
MGVKIIAISQSFRSMRARIGLKESGAVTG